MAVRSRAFEVEVVPALTPVSPSALADATFELFRRGAFSLLVLSAATNVPLFASIAALVLFVRDRGWSWGTFSYFAVLTLLGFAAALSTWLRAIGTGAMAYAAARAGAGRPAGPAASLGAALKVGAALPLVCAIRLGSIAIGLGACALPGISVLAGLAMAPHAVVLEGHGVSGALARSLRLATAGATGLAAAGALNLAIYLIGTIQLVLALRLAEGLVTLAIPSLPGGWLQRPEMPYLLLGTAKVLADPFVSSATAAVWMDARIRADGLDLELRAQSVAGENPSLVPEAA